MSKMSLKNMVIMMFIVGIFLAQVGETMNPMNAFRRSVNVARASNMFQRGLHTKGGGGRGGGERGGGGSGGRGKPVYKPGHNPSRPPKYPIVRTGKFPRPGFPVMQPLKPFEFGKFSLVAESIAPRLHQPFRFDSIQIMLSTLSRKRLTDTIAEVAKKTGKKGIHVISVMIALGAAVSMVKAFENRQIVETFPGTTSGEIVDETAINQVLERWSERIIERGGEPTDAELVESFVEAFGYDEMVLGTSMQDVELVDAIIPQSTTEIHALAYAIQKQLYDGFASIREKLHGVNLEVLIHTHTHTHT